MNVRDRARRRRSRSSRSTGPSARNAVDGPTAAALADAFRAFDADDALAVAVLTGAGGTFCAGADLKAMLDGDAGNRVDGRRRRPDGPDADAARQAGDRGGRGLRGRGRARARALVRPARRRARRGVRRVLPPLGRAADRRRHRAAPAARSAEPRARPDPHRPRRRPATRRCAWGSPTGSPSPGDALDDAVALAHELAALPQDVPAHRPAVGVRAVRPAARRRRSRNELDRGVTRRSRDDEIRAGRPLRGGEGRHGRAGLTDRGARRRPTASRRHGRQPRRQDRRRDATAAEHRPRRARSARS